jgi:hypothetical protein
MAQQQWEVESASGRCAISGRVFEEGEEFFTVLLEEGETFRRADYSLDAWEGPPESYFCHFKTRVPIKEKRKKLLVNNELLVNFFLRLEGETEPVRIHFRFVLALILMRKRLLKYEGTTVEEGIETWRMILPADQSEHAIINPRLTDDQVEGVSGQLTAILHGDMGPWAQVADAVDVDSDEDDAPEEQQPVEKQDADDTA